MIALGPALRFHGGGHLNHSIFWQNLAPGGGEPDAALIKAAEGSFGSFENMKASLSAATVAIQGSGWGWLGYNKQSKNLSIITCPNQDPLEPTTGNPPLHKKKEEFPLTATKTLSGLVPLLGIDVWEHAYYLQYKNVRADYVKNIFNIVNWADVSQRLAAASN